jgi:hypothetical protein
MEDNKSDDDGEYPSCFDLVFTNTLIYDVVLQDAVRHVKGRIGIQTYPDNAEYVIPEPRDHWLYYSFEIRYENEDGDYYIDYNSPKFGYTGHCKSFCHNVGNGSLEAFKNWLKMQLIEENKNY